MCGSLDILHREGLPRRERNDMAAPIRRFLSVWFRCCHVYGRMNRNRSQTAYEGRCPKCGARVRARIGPDGTSHRMFQAR